MRTSLTVIVAVSIALAFTAAPAAGAGVAAGASSSAGDATAGSLAALGAQEAPGCEFPFEETDATGETVTVEEEPDDVVALQPSDAQSVFEIGGEDKLVGMPVGQYTDYLEPDENLDISEDDDLTPITEAVVDREPDVVLAGNTLEDDDVVDQLRNAGLTVFVFPTEDSLDGVEENVRLTGEIVGECDGAAATIDWMDDTLEEIDEALADEDRPLAYYAMGDGYTAGEGSFSHEILTTAGLENLGAEVGIEGWDMVDAEQVVEQDPDWIVYGETWGEPPVGDGVMATSAYEDEQFVAVNDHYMSQPAPLVVVAIAGIVEDVHPNAYEESGLADDERIDHYGDMPAGALDAGDGDDAGADGTDTGEADDDSIPGFAASTALVAVLLTSLAVVRSREKE
ncbi:PGF-CTERM-anchored ABC transporter substrate-binding protein [Natronobacterium gregoryi]|uniref:ABC transporter periplasmic protein n=2 Tax=Natronobacterium gregoryi TaxID=44930 RepID=L0AMA2_NATGS|nr:PGF-CTERM-anchored ABC transporter substrate-binding protein [Natronobacterium gregoryi]AFZ74921.1 ABC-type Fe3+-hydroxamate transport system, periplasmic component [Natronobacterium gregoryi SP2]ELY67354.1 ABC transporter periplasmic protein [Natronobacterium gregoryi SP2]PLK19849.1 ABC transporter substrate-binding protein [Natronobacterium gregoryi SP2]SFJ39149.1 iron complex transport system substrate-binding protein [Natronobacterium gregoryi]